MDSPNQPGEREEVAKDGVSKESKGKLEDGEPSHQNITPLIPQFTLVADC